MGFNYSVIAQDVFLKEVSSNTQILRLLLIFKQSCRGILLMISTIQTPVHSYMARFANVINNLLHCACAIMFHISVSGSYNYRVYQFLE